MMSKRESVWLAGIETPARPSLESDRRADVVVIGGGVAGMTTALLLQLDGFEVVVVEAERIGHGSTGKSTGKVSSLHGLLYHKLIERHGRERAARYGEANQQAIDVVEAMVEKMSPECHFARVPAYVYTTATDNADELRSEHEAASSLGLPAHLTTETDLPFEVALALRFDDQGRRSVHDGFGRTLRDCGGNDLRAFPSRRSG